MFAFACYHLLENAFTLRLTSPMPPREKAPTPLFVRLPADLDRQVRAYSAATGIPLSRLAADALRLLLEQRGVRELADLESSTANEHVPARPKARSQP